MGLNNKSKRNTRRNKHVARKTIRKHHGGGLKEDALKALANNGVDTTEAGLDKYMRNNLSVPDQAWNGNAREYRSESRKVSTGGYTFQHSWMGKTHSLIAWKTTEPKKTEIINMYFD